MKTSGAAETRLLSEQGEIYRLNLWKESKIRIILLSFKADVYKRVISGENI